MNASCCDAAQGAKRLIRKRLSIDYSGQTIDGRYRIIRLLDKGGMGSVYLGEHVVIGKKVAVKFLHLEHTGNEEIVKRFYREARAAAAIGHKNIIDVLDVGISQAGQAYLVMEYLEGESLSHMLERTGPIDLPAACGIIEPVLRALSAVHEKGIIHRDLKPENIFLEYASGETPAVKLIDFGVSKFSQGKEAAQLTLTGTFIGTPAYMSPEQARARYNVDHRTDLYALGVILYEMLTGELPYQGDHYNDMLANMLTSEPRPPNSVYPDFPKEAEPLIMQMLEKSPKDRPSSANEALEAIRALSSESQRKERLAYYASGLAQSSFAGGDLGEILASHSDSNASSLALAEVPAQITANGWTETRVVAEQRPRLPFGIVGAILFAGMAMAIALFLAPKSAWIKIRTGNSSRTSHPDNPQSNREAHWLDGNAEGVVLAVQGLPPGATIYYDSAKVPMNPFRVKSAKTLTQIKIKAKGFSEFITAVVPDRDQVVEVTLKPNVKKKGQARPRRKIIPKKRSRFRPKWHQARSKSRRPSTAVHTKSPKTGTPKNTVKKTKTGTEFTEFFD